MFFCCEMSLGSKVPLSVSLPLASQCIHRDTLRRMKTKFKGIAWLGIRTDKFDELLDFYKNKMELPVIHEEPGFRAFDLPNGDRVEIFSEEYTSDGNDYRHFSTGPVAGFLVDNIEEAKKEMESEGIEFIGPVGEGSTSKWAHFRGVDGNTYELMQRLA